MTIMTETKLTAAIKTVGRSLATWRESVQEILVSVAYQAMRGNSNHANNLLGALMDGGKSAAHIQGITRWLETFAPLIVREGLFKINKGALKNISVASEEDFAKQYEPAMREVSWWLMGEKQRPESIFDAGTFVPNRLAAVAKKLNSEGYPELGAEVSALLKMLYSTNAWKKATAVPAAAPKPATPAGETIEGTATRITDQPLRIAAEHPRAERPLPLSTFKSRVLRGRTQARQGAYKGRGGVFVG